MTRTNPARRRLLTRHHEALNRRENVPALAALYGDEAVVVSPMFDTVRGQRSIAASFEPTAQDLSGLHGDHARHVVHH